jgi:hypothetical protein
VTATCPRCGAPLHPLADLAALETRRLALPSVVAVALQEARLDCRILAERLSCHAGLCRAPEATP